MDARSNIRAETIAPGEGGGELYRMVDYADNEGVS